MVADAEEDYIDVDMASADAYEEDTASTQVAANMQNVNDAASRTGVFVPFYPHLGGSDFDDEYVFILFHTRVHANTNLTSVIYCSDLE